MDDLSTRAEWLWADFADAQRELTASIRATIRAFEKYADAEHDLRQQLKREFGAGVAVPKLYSTEINDLGCSVDEELTRLEQERADMTREAGLALAMMEQGQ